MEINVYDKNFNTYLKFIEYIKINKSKNKINFLKKLKKQKKIDLLILSTYSTDRLKIFKKLTSLCEIRNALFEKIVFTDKASFDEAIAIKKKYNIKIWVNCLRREVPIYNEIKNKIGNRNIALSYTGCNWGMGSNVIHFIDLFFYLKKTKNIKIISKIKKIISSKRKNFNEILGHINFIDQNNNKLYLEDSKRYMQNKLEIKFGDKKFVLKNGEVTCKINNIIINKKKINENVSEITRIFVNKLFAKDKIKLTTLEKSKIYHQIFFQIIEKYNKKNYINKINFT